MGVYPLKISMCLLLLTKVGVDVDPSHICKTNTDLGMYVTLNLSQKAVMGKGFQKTEISKKIKSSTRSSIDVGRECKKKIL